VIIATKLRISHEKKKEETFFFGRLQRYKQTKHVHSSMFSASIDEEESWLDSHMF